MNYIVLDLEWNQSNNGPEEETAELLFEVIEIGAVKLNDAGVMISEFSQLVKPEVYHEMHQITSRLIHLADERAGEREAVYRGCGGFSGLVRL